MGMSTVFVIVTLLGVAVAALPRQLAQIFSEDPTIIDLFEQIRYPLAVVMVREWASG
jgi:Na+-driven multidrug efflux pump